MESKLKSSETMTPIAGLQKVPLIALMEHSKIPFAIKDKESRVQYINDACKKWLNLPKLFDFEGRRDDEFPHPIAAFAAEFQAQDRKAEKDKGAAEVIITSYFGRDCILEPYYSPKFPIHNSEGEVIGSLLYQRKFSFISIGQFFNALKPSVITLTPPVDLFTERELEIIFYAIQRIPAKEIAPKLYISHRTVENRLLRIYEKISVNSVNGLIDYCHHVGLNNYVPKKLLREGVNFCW
ncbi:Putative transcriptional regulator, PAS and GerEdomains, LuxR family [Sodalis praecaptivus]|uniref:Putative transcriptional regulator, PAS and GerEdomains, LuxR family n=1 Tax=Sodalis praecaptivus TaxID=1239307 RepID=W0HWJ0_9GAMM|nr:PAS and helix-turn-helix domain-containing protein [Sodalis praecaptivus]AHF78144.1 Putative transcriptional regulator, PAS and GerEdomains, LuxR family [Sodalis praecaptivus]